MNSTSPHSYGRAFTLVALLVIVAVLAILAGLLLPALARAKQKAQRIACVNNLKQCGLAFRLWSTDNGDRYPMAVSNRFGGTLEFLEGGNAFRHYQVLSNELSTPRILVCPSDNREAASVFQRLRNANISYFVGLDADETQPQLLLTGDRNITNSLEPRKTVLMLLPQDPPGWTEEMHDRQGNIGLADGSVQQLTTLRLHDVVRNTGDATNRIALPE